MAGYAYLYQIVNLLITIAMVPLLLRYLDEGYFILWSVFTTFGGVTLQLESAIQMVSVREIAKEYHSGNVAELKAVIKKAKAAYMVLTVSVLVPFFVCGLLYINYVVSEKIDVQGNVEWMIFILAYAINYYFAINNSILLGMVRVSQYNLINTLTRIINFITTYLFLSLGFSVLGVSLSFAASVLIGVLLISRVAKRSLEDHMSLTKEGFLDNEKFSYVSSSNVLNYTFYMLSAFVVYKGGFLIAITVFSKNVVASYGLTLQAYTMLSIFSLVLPLQVRLHKLVSAVASENKQNVLYELAAGVLVANSLFVMGSVFLVVFGDFLLVFIDSKVMLLDSSNLLLIGLAFLVELNIMLLVNFLVVVKNYRFVKIYMLTSLVGAFCAFVLTWWLKSGVSTLIVVPLGLQLFLCLPLIFIVVSRELIVTPKMLVRQLGKLILVRR